MLNKLRIWWKWHGRYIPNDIKYGIKNLIKWFPIIWVDRDWDQNFIWTVLKFKLKKQGESIRDYGHHVGSEYDGNRMLLCSKLIDLISQEWYELEYFEYFKDEHWFTDSPDSDLCKMLNTKPVSENFEEYFAKYPLIYKKVLNGGGPLDLRDQDDDDYKKIVAMSMGMINHQRAKDLLFKIINRDIESWWS